MSFQIFLYFGPVALYMLNKLFEFEFEIFRLRQFFQQTGGVADRRKPGRPRVTNP